VWRLVVTPFDGEVVGDVVMAEVVIANTPPTTPIVVLDKVEFTTNETIKPRLVKPAADADNDAIQLEYRWVRDDEVMRLPRDKTELLPVETNKGESWQVMITPNDGQMNGETVTLDFGIVNTPPTPPKIKLSQIEATTRDVVKVELLAEGQDIDGDHLRYRYYWFRNGVPLTEWPLTKADLKPGQAHKGELLRVEVTADDGESESEQVGAEVRIVNHPPNTPRVAIQPRAPQTSDPLACRADAEGIDPDQERVAFRIAWWRDGALMPFSPDMDVVPPSFTRRGQQWRCEVTAFDGTATSDVASSNAVEIKNTPPSTPKVKILPDVVTTETGLRCLIQAPAVDDDNDPITYRYRWFRDRKRYRSERELKGAGVAEIPPGVARRGELWSCEVIASDGELDSAPGQAVAQIENASPSVAKARLMPPRPVLGDDLRCEVAAFATDADGDQLFYRFTWFKNGKREAFAPTSVEVPSRLIKAGDVWQCTITANDGKVDGPRAVSNPETIAAPQNSGS
jgi:hypothetical protein